MDRELEKEIHNRKGPTQFWRLRGPTVYCVQGTDQEPRAVTRAKSEGLGARSAVHESMGDGVQLQERIGPFLLFCSNQARSGLADAHLFW